MRLIDADALYSETEKKIKANNECRMAVVDGEFLDLINDADTVDAVEVVRCKDCMFYDSDISYCRIMVGKMRDTAFCSYGTRREV